MSVRSKGMSTQMHLRACIVDFISMQHAQIWGWHGSRDALFKQLRYSNILL
jgi:hypothetical protein